jgi:N-acetylmuramic acid 6-phosphate etherase
MDESPAKHPAVISQLEHLISEERNPNTMEIDLLSTAEVLRAMNCEDRSVPDAVGKVIDEIARAVDRIVDLRQRRAAHLYGSGH